MLQKAALFLVVISIGVGTVGLLSMGYARIVGIPVPGPDALFAYFSTDRVENVSLNPSASYTQSETETPAAVELTEKGSEPSRTAQIPSAQKLEKKNPVSQIRNAIASVLPKPEVVATLTASTPSDSPEVSTEDLSVPVSTGHSQFVYMRGLSGGWTPNTSGTHAIFNAAGMFGSLEAVSITLANAQDVVRWNRLGGVDIKEYEGILIWVKGSSGGERVRITLYDTSGAVLGTANVADYLSSKKISSTEYQRAFIPFQMINSKRRDIGAISFGSNQSARFFIDSMMFSNTPDGLSIAGFLYNTHPAVFESDFRNTWALEETGVSVEIISTDDADSGYALLARLPNKGDTISMVNTLNMYSSSLKNFVFNMRGPGAADRHVTITFYNENSLELGHVRMKTYTKQGDFYKIQKVTIPLSDLGVARNYIKKITFTAEDGQIQELRLSDIRFEL